MKIIIASSKKNSLKKISTICKKNRYSVLTLSIPENNLIENIKTFIPDLIILDFKSGLYYKKKLKILFAQIFTPIIFITDSYSKKDELKAYKAGASDYFLQDISSKIFETKIKRLLKIKFLQNALYSKNRKLIDLTGLMKKYLPGNLQDEIFSKSKINLNAKKKFFAIFFSDIRNFTELSTHYTPGEMLDLLNCYLYFAYDKIIFNNGKIDKVIGDAILAVFEKSDDDSEPCYNAVKAALEIHEEMRSFNELMEQSPKFSSGNIFPFIQLGIGINYAEVVQGNLGTPDRMDFTVIGDGVNMASRCQHIALGEEVIITEEVYKRIKQRVDVEILPPVNIKGKKEKIQLYRIERLY
ncbi:hypothetical protein KA977_02160 [Candidatus Dependentiae bacterium]|nr:hypothetical protein [Candidatus Dependentiae bacterium]